MTIFESLSMWIWGILTDPSNELPGQYNIFAEVLPDQVGVENTALFSNPNDIQTPLNGGQIKNESYKTFYIRKDFLEQQTRMNNEAFFEKLRKCIHMKNLRARYPSDGRKWREISYQGGCFVTQRAENNEYAIYQINLKLVYLE